MTHTDTTTFSSDRYILSKCVVFQAGIKENRYTFTAREWDSESSTYHYRARQYNPYTGRFGRRDIIEYFGEFNLYNYVINNPIIYVDPSGEKVWLCVTFGFLSNTAGFPGHVSLKIENAKVKRQFGFGPASGWTNALSGKGEIYDEEGSKCLCYPLPDLCEEQEKYLYALIKEDEANPPPFGSYNNCLFWALGVYFKAKEYGKVQPIPPEPPPKPIKPPTIESPTIELEPEPFIATPHTMVSPTLPQQPIKASDTSSCGEKK